MARYRFENTDPPPAINGWKAFNTRGEGEDTQQLTNTVAHVLECDNLVVLTGLGTSLCIRRGEKTLFPTMGGLWDDVKAKIGDDAFEATRILVNHKANNNIEDLLSRCIVFRDMFLDPPAIAPQSEMAPKPANTIGDATTADIAGFVKDAETTIHTKCNQALEKDDTRYHEDFLRRLTVRSHRNARANLFTTNYDRCFEVAASRIGLPIIDGFTFSAPPVFMPELLDYDIVQNSSYSKAPDYIPRLLRFHKLHGSVDWNKSGGIIERRHDATNPALIYPQSGKYASSYSPPFLELMSRFQSLLRQGNLGVIVLCCGFNDIHLAEPLFAAIQSNNGMRMLICSPDLCGHDAKALYDDPGHAGTIATNDYLKRINSLVDDGDRRIVFVNCKFPEFVRLMPVTTSETDTEKHMARIEAMRKFPSASSGGSNGQ